MTRSKSAAEVPMALANTGRYRTPTENEYHNSLISRDTIGGGVKGLAVGTALGALGKHTGYMPGALAYAAPVVGGFLGASAGNLRGREDVLKDIVGDERKRRDHVIRKNKELDEAMMNYGVLPGGADAPKLASVRMRAFSDELEKQAFVGALGGMVTKGIGRGLGAMAKSQNKTIAGWGQSGAKRLGGAMRAGVHTFGSRKNLNRVVGGGTLLAGGGLAAGAALT